MRKSDAEKYNNYCVYDIDEEEKETHYYCTCKDYEEAKIIAMSLAWASRKHKRFYVTSINSPLDMVPGGGWYDSWHKNEQGKLVQSSLS